MNFKRFFLIVFSLCFLPSLVLAGTAHYVDCNAGQNGNGRYASPWNNISSVNSHNFSTGDDVYFKVNTTCNVSDRLTIDWSGSSGDQAIIGAYYGNGQFGLNGNPRPIIDGQNTVPSLDETALIGAIGYTYLTVKDLKVINSAGYGIMIKNSNYSTIENCYTDHTYRFGIGITKTRNSTISDNIVNDGYYWTGVGDCIDIGGAHKEGTSLYNTITRNIVSNCNEGIGIYGMASYTTVEYNVVRDTSYSIYHGTGKNNIIRYNLIYSTSAETGSGRGVCVDNEAAREYCYIGNSKIYGNLIAGKEQGILISNEWGKKQTTTLGVPGADSCNTTGILVYNNTLVDNTYNIRIVYDDAGWTGNKIRNNISLTLTGGTFHANNFSPAGFTWSHNNFDDSVTGKAATKAIIGNPALKKSSGWRSLKAGSLDGTEFSLLPGSKAINAGISIASYNNRITATDYTADPIMVMKSTDSTPDIGAWMNSNAQTNNLAPPTDLSITGQ